MRAAVRILALLTLVLSFGAVSFEGCMKKGVIEKTPADRVRKELDRFAPVEFRSNLSYLDPKEVDVIRHLVKASQFMDEIFLRQVDEDNPRLREILADMKEPDAGVYRDFFAMMFGPWNRIDGDRPFLNVKSKPAGAAFYPADMTRDEFVKFIGMHPEKREAFEGNFTVIRRSDGGLVPIPYSEYYREWLIPAAGLLKEAAGMTSNPSLKKYLESRADAFLSNDYFLSDLVWMDLSGDIEIVIGPYETYEDGLFGYKAAFESYVCLVDHEESARQRAIVGSLDALEKALPMPAAALEGTRGNVTPIKVVNVLYTAGDSKAGVQTAAFNLPNDERVRKAKGSKNVMLKNVMRAKFEKCWLPIVRTALAEKDLPRVSFEAYFAHTLMHEVSHGLGPGILSKNGRETTVQKELKEAYPVIEECKADVLGILTAQALIDRGVFPGSLESSLYATNLGGLFRSVRFGIGEAHGGGVAIQLNVYIDKAACAVGSDGRFSVDDAAMKRATRELAADLLRIEADADYTAAKAFIEKHGSLRPEVRAVLDRMTGVPVDIRPVYAIDKETKNR
jgi:hypothetical protein